jgi:hypothetical protein
MPTPINAVVVLMDGEFGLLPHWVAHYRRLGVDRIIVAANTAGVPADGPWPEPADDLFLHRFAALDWSDFDQVKDAAEEAAMDAAGVRPEDWTLRVDLDEFHEYPGPLRALLDELSDETLGGRLLDRVALSRQFEPLRPTPSVFAQYPLAGDVTASYGGHPAKIMACRRRVALLHGRHGTAQALTVAWLGTVHHFKYRGEGVARVRDRIGHFNAKGTYGWYANGSRRLLEGQGVDAGIALHHVGEFRYWP